MNAPVTIAQTQPLAPVVEILALLADSAARSYADFPLDIPDVVDPCQEFAESTGLVAAIGQDAVQEIIGAPFAWLRGEWEPLPYDYAAQILRQWDLADPRDRWRITGEPPPPAHIRNSAIGALPAVVDEFWHVVSLEDPARLKAWLADHSRDAPYLLKLLEGK